MPNDRVARTLDLAARRVPQMAALAMLEEAEIEMTEAKERTPVDWGNLRDSGHVEDPEIQGRDISVRLVFGGPAAPYALYVHEDLDAHHTVGQAKFLESVLNESRPFLAARIARHFDLDALMRGGA